METARARRRRAGARESGHPSYHCPPPRPGAGGATGRRRSLTRAAACHLPSCAAAAALDRGCHLPPEMSCWPQGAGVGREVLARSTLDFMAGEDPLIGYAAALLHGEERVSGRPSVGECPARWRRGGPRGFPRRCSLLESWYFGCTGKDRHCRPVAVPTGIHVSAKDTRATTICRGAWPRDVVCSPILR